MKINHFYHVYTDGDWVEAVDEHCTALKEHGLADELDGFYLGLVGTEENRLTALSRITMHHNMNAEVIAEAPFQWEQVTLEPLRRFSTTNDGYVLYAHTKGAANHTPINIAWRSSMCYYNVVKWRDAVAKLDEGYKAVGCHWVNDAIFGGNYWWAKTSYLKLLPTLRMDHRWRAEEWIGLAIADSKTEIFDMNFGWPDFVRFTTSW